MLNTWWGETKQARSATMALVYITVGALVDVWTVVYGVYLVNHGGSDVSFYWGAGFFFTGLVLMGIGFAVGRIGRSAKQAEATDAPMAQVVVPPPPVVSAPAAPNPNGATYPHEPVATHAATPAKEHVSI